MPTRTKTNGHFLTGYTISSSSELKTTQVGEMYDAHLERAFTSSVPF